jgi:hypothetical protein
MLTEGVKPNPIALDAHNLMERESMKPVEIAFAFLCLLAVIAFAAVAIHG